MAPAVKRRTALLLMMLAVSSAFAAWQWFRPYQWSVDPAARFEIAHASLLRDHSFYWLDLHLKHRGDAGHDLAKPVRLVFGDGRELEPAETTFEGDAEQATRSLGLRFWLEDRDFSGPLHLRLNDGRLEVRKRSGPPVKVGTSSAHFTTSDW
jgi:hypothetical protein